MSTPPACAALRREVPGGTVRARRVAGSRGSPTIVRATAMPPHSSGMLPPMEITLDALRQVARLAGFEWDDAELEALGPPPPPPGAPPAGPPAWTPWTSARPSRPRSTGSSEMTELHWTPAADLARMIADKEVSPVEVVRAHLDRVAALDGKLRAFITVCAEPALEAARPPHA